MKFTKHLILLAFLLLQSVSAFAANWVFVGESANSQYYIDKESMIRTGSKVQCWMRTNYNDPQTEKYPIVDTNNKYSSDLSYSEYDCYNRTLRGLEFNSYSEKDGGGSVVKSHSFTSSTHLIRIPPGTVAEAVMKFVCKLSMKK